MVGHGGSRAGSYLADPTSPIPSHCASIVTTSTLRVNCCSDYTMLSSVSSYNKTLVMTLLVGTVGSYVVKEVLLGTRGSWGMSCFGPLHAWDGDMPRK